MVSSGMFKFEFIKISSNETSLVEIKNLQRVSTKIDGNARNLTPLHFLDHLMFSYATVPLTYLCGLFLRSSFFTSSNPLIEEGVW